MRLEARRGLRIRNSPQNLQNLQRLFRIRRMRVHSVRSACSLPRRIFRTDPQKIPSEIVRSLYSLFRNSNSTVRKLHLREICGLHLAEIC